MKNDWETIALRKKQCALINNPSLQKVWPEKNLEFTRLCMQNIYHDFSTF